MTEATLRAEIAGDTARGIPQSAAALAYSGALPLIVAAILVTVKPESFGVAAQDFMIVYGGALIAFFGGVRWGVAVMRPGGPGFRSLIAAAVPLLAALPMFFAGEPRLKLAFIVLALPALLVDDLRATRRGSGAPEWYLGVRAPLTILMEASFVAALAAALRA